MSAMTTVSRRAAAAAALAPLAAIAVAAGSVPAAHADARFALPNGKFRGEGITIIKTGERVRVGPSMAANGAGRSAWVTGKVKVLAPGIDKREAGPNNGARGEDSMPGSNGTHTTGAGATLSVGYVVGCQVDIGQASIGGTGATLKGAPSLDALGGTFAVPVSPGRIIYAQIERKQLEEPGTYFFEWRNAQMEIQGCGGFAQARSYVTVEATGENHRKYQLWGKPFTIG